MVFILANRHFLPRAPSTFWRGPRSLAYSLAVSLAAAASFACARHAFPATTRDWSPPDFSSSSNWNAPGNWSPTGVPQAGDTVNIIGGGIGSLNETVNYDYTGPDITLGPLTLTRSNSTFSALTTTDILAMSANSLHTNLLYVGFSPGRGRGQIDQSGGTLTVDDDLFLGQDSNDFGGYALSGGMLSARTLTIGNAGFASLTQSAAGVLDATDIVLGDLPSASGTYTFNATAGSLNLVEYLQIGNRGAGTFNQSDGNLSVPFLDMAHDPASTATFNLTGGYFQAQGKCYLGDPGAAIINQSGGQFTCGGILLGSAATSASPSIYNLSGGTLTTSTITVADSGTFNFLGGAVSQTSVIDDHGIFNLLAPTTLAPSTLTLGGASDSAVFNHVAGNLLVTLLEIGHTTAGAGTFHLNGTGAFLQGYQELIGGQRSGTFIQSAGTHEVTGSLEISAASPASADYQLHDGALNVLCDEVLAPGEQNPQFASQVATFEQTGGTHTVAAPFSLIIGSGFSVARYSLTGGTLAAYAIAVGSEDIDDVQPSNSLDVQNAGSLTISGSLAVYPFSTATLASSQTLFNIPAVTLDAGSLTLSGPSKTLRTSGLTIYGTPGNWSGLLDLTTNSLLVQSSSSNKSAALATLISQIQNPPLNHGTLNGIISTSALGDINHYAVGLFDNAFLGLLSLDGAMLDANSLLVSAAHRGDANDSGIVDIQDQSIITNHWQSAQNNWAAGDLNLDGFVDLQDLTLVTNDWQQSSTLSQAPAFPASFALGVPEPGSLALLALGAAALLRRRRPRGLTPSDC